MVAGVKLTTSIRIRPHRGDGGDLVSAILSTILECKLFQKLVQGSSPHQDCCSSYAADRVPVELHRDRGGQ
jgi:hypothetical protein